MRRYGVALAPLTLLVVAAQAEQRGARQPKTTEKSGAQVYATQCAACHGAKGEGTKAYPKALTGTQTPEQLAKFIVQTMPPGPKHATLAEATSVSRYVYDAFYSPLASAKNSPARVALSRLTVRQFRAAVADLLGTFTPPTPRTESHGLQASYYKARSFSDSERVIARVDPAVDFDFGTVGPVAEKFDPHTFSIRWEGSLVAPETGEYELIVRTEHSLRLWVNDMKTPLIDGWVKSGNDTEYRASVYLLGGRAYPLRLEFSKSSQGVDDSKKKEGKPAPKASISLSWRRPKLTEERIPTRQLLTTTTPEVLVLATPFPPDDRSIGYERGTSVSRAWQESVTAAALAAAEEVVRRQRVLIGNPDDPARVTAFCKTFVERALRQPLTPELESAYVTRPLASTPDRALALKRVVLFALTSPRFLYRELGTSDAYAVASRLAFTLWDSLPDAELLRAAAKNELSTRAQIAAQAERMSNDPRARFKLREFFLQWLKVDQYPDLAKDTKRFPGFDEAVATDLRTSLELTLEDCLASESADFRTLMLSDSVFLNGRLAALYGVDLPKGAPFQRVTLDTKERAGVLMHPYILASFAYLEASSPIHRGVLLARSVLGRTLAPPPVAVAPLAPSLLPNLTTRQRVTRQTSPKTCQSCHGMINALGFTLERFDAIGRVRTTDNAQPVDTHGSYQTRTGETVAFAGARDLARFVATSDEAHAAFVEKLFQYAVKQPIRAYGPQETTKLQKTFASNGFNIRKLMVEIATDAAEYREK